MDYHWKRKVWFAKNSFPVEVNNCRSIMLVTSIGLSKGAVLDPLFCTMYVNDFACNEAILFADNTTLVISNKTRKEVFRPPNVNNSVTDQIITKKFRALYISENLQKNSYHMLRPLPTLCIHRMGDLSDIKGLLDLWSSKAGEIAVKRYLQS